MIYAGHGSMHQELVGTGTIVMNPIDDAQISPVLRTLLKRVEDSYVENSRYGFPAIKV